MSVKRNNVCVELVSRSPEQTQELGRRLGELAMPGDVYLLIGNLGAGKTCFTQGIAWGLGIQEYTLSPSFVLIRELHGRLPLYHIDLYRLEKLEESMELGLDDYFYGRGVSIIEWADRALNIMPPEHLAVNIGYLNATERSFQIKPSGKRYLRLVEELRRASSGIIEK